VFLFRRTQSAQKDGHKIESMSAGSLRRTGETKKRPPKVKPEKEITNNRIQKDQCHLGSEKKKKRKEKKNSASIG